MKTYFGKIRIIPLYIGVVEDSGIGYLIGRMYKSLDGGINWRKTKESVDDTFFIMVDTNNSNIIYAYAQKVASLNDPRNWAFLYKSVDQGEWNIVPTESFTFITGMSLNNGVLYILTSKGDILKSINGGDNWSPINTNFRPTTLVMDPTIPNRLYIASVNPSGIFYSTAGNEWKQLNTQNNAQLPSLLFPQHIYLNSGKRVLYAPTSDGIYVIKLEQVDKTLKSQNGEVLGEKIINREAQLETINSDATYITTAPAAEVASAVNEKRDLNLESQTNNQYISPLIKGLGGIVDEVKFALNNFISYGTETTKSLGAGERAGVVNSFQSAFGNLPESAEEWQDVIKIANGRWPTQRNSMAETKAKASFKKIYGKEANMSNQNDNAAVTVMAYGLRPSQRNLDSEKAAILSFKYFYKRSPVSAIDWDTVRAIAYSGAKR